MKKRLSKEERRLQLIEAALKAFSRKGYHGTQVSDICAEAKVARGTFYLHFESKRALFDQLLQEIFRRVREVIRPINKQDISKIPGDILGNIERATQVLFDNPAYIKIMFSDAVGLDTELDERLREYYKMILGLIRGGLVQGQNLGLIREGDIDILSLCLMGSLKECLYQYTLGTYRPPVKKLIQEVYRIVLNTAIRPELVEELQSSLGQRG